MTDMLQQIRELAASIENLRQELHCHPSDVDRIRKALAAHWNGELFEVVPNALVPAGHVFVFNKKGLCNGNGCF